MTRSRTLDSNPAIYGNNLTCYITRHIRGQVNNGPYHLLGCGWPRQRSSTHCHFKNVRVFPKGFAEASFGQAWSDGVYLDIVLSPLLSHHLCGHNHSSFAYGVNGQYVRGNSSDRRNIDNFASTFLPHHPGHRL